MKKKTLHAQKRIELQDEELGTFTCYGSVFGEVDLASDSVQKGAFTESLEYHKEIGTMPIFLWNHDENEILGKWVSAEEDEIGLKLTGQFNLNTDIGKRRYQELKHGDLNGFSIGYYYNEDDVNTIDGVNYLTEVVLSEVSLVPFPCNQLAQVIDVKSAKEEVVTLNKEDDEHKEYVPLFKRSDVVAFAKQLQKRIKK